MSGPSGAAILGVAVVDFNHLVSYPKLVMHRELTIEIGPTVEYAYPASLQAAIANDEDLNRLLPFLALPDGAHLVSSFILKFCDTS